MNQKEYIRWSLELHLFFDRIMKEHSIFIEGAFLEKEKELKKIANSFQRNFSDILEKIIDLSNGNISNKLIESNEFVTNNTLQAENQTSSLSGIKINAEITLKELNLRSGEINPNEQLLNSISLINRKTLPLIENLINFKNNILNQVLLCKMYTANYPLLINHIKNEAIMYHTKSGLFHPLNNLKLFYFIVFLINITINFKFFTFKYSF